jgi:hydrogenase/urease accessory protein HupE
MLQRFWALWVACLALACHGPLTGQARAHEIRPAIVTATVNPDNTYDIAVSLNLEAVMAGVNPRHRDTDDAPEAVTYNGLRRLDTEALRTQFQVFAPRWTSGIQIEFDGSRATPAIASIDVPSVADLARARISVVHLKGQTAKPATTFRWSYPAEFGSSVVRIKLAGQEAREVGWLKDGEASAVVPLGQMAAPSRIETFIRYVTVGFTHIVPLGADHILFVLGLYLFGSTWRPLLIQVTAFTVAHSITLALGLAGLVEVPASIVEPLIALSIVYVAVENITTTQMPVWRPVVVFCFGLLHGLGFASVLQEIGLERGDYVLGLVGFNIGIELAQLSVIATAWLFTGYLFGDKIWYRHRIVWPLSALIALTGALWTAQRVVMA